jgi:hypothetical protein
MSPAGVAARNTALLCSVSVRVSEWMVAGSTKQKSRGLRMKHGPYIEVIWEHGCHTNSFWDWAITGCRHTCHTETAERAVTEKRKWQAVNVFCILSIRWVKRVRTRKVISVSQHVLVLKPLHRFRLSLVKKNYMVEFWDFSFSQRRVGKWRSFGLLRRVVWWKLTDVSELFVGSVIKAIAFSWFIISD